MVVVSSSALVVGIFSAGFSSVGFSSALVVGFSSTLVPGFIWFSTIFGPLPSSKFISNNSISENQSLKFSCFIISVFKDKSVFSSIFMFL